MPEYAQFQAQMTFSGSSGLNASPPKAAKAANFAAHRRKAIDQTACARTFSRAGST